MPKSRQLESDETSLVDVDLLEVFMNSGGRTISVVRGKDGKLVVAPVEASTQNGEKRD